MKSKKWTIDQLRREFERYREQLSIPTINNCGPISREIRHRFYVDYGDEFPLLIGDGWVFPADADTDEEGQADTQKALPENAARHVFLVVEAEHLTDAEDAVVFDPTLDQFCSERDNEVVDDTATAAPVTFGPRDDLPSVGIAEGYETTPLPNGSRASYATADLCHNPSAEWDLDIIESISRGGDGGN